MTTVAQQPLNRPSFEPSDRIPIAQLSPCPTASSSSYILANIALVWPYSSSTDTLALLLADTDIRLRKFKGQVKVVFRGGCAREVAKSHIGIGDLVKLALTGCEWKETGDAVSTPGKKIDWDLEYRARLVLQLLRDDKVTFTIDYTRNEPDSSALNGLTTLRGGRQDALPPLNGVVHPKANTILVPYLTPVKSAGNSFGGTFIDASLDLLAQDDGYVVGRGRKRTKFARHSGAWSLVDSDEEGLEEISTVVENGESTQQSPARSCQEIDLSSIRGHHATGGEQEEDLDKNSWAQAITAPPIVNLAKEQTTEASHPDSISETIQESAALPPVIMGPPQTPLRTNRLQISPDIGTHDLSKEDSEAATTPRLLPLTSPGLPLVSPLICRSDVEVGYFPQFEKNISQLDASGEKQVEIAVQGVAKEPTLDDGGSVNSDEPRVVSEETSTQRQEVIAVHENLQDTDEPDIAQPAQSPAPVSSSFERSIRSQLSNSILPEQWFPSREATISQEWSRTQKDPSLHTVVHKAAQIVEVEDDDLYGAPEDTAKGNDVPTTSTSLEQPRSPLDVLERFLQMSPVATVGRSFGSETLVASSPRATPHDDPSANWQEQVTLSAVECRSPDAYPVPPLPFQQNRHTTKSSRSSSRRSPTHHSQVHSLDENVDERESLPEEQNVVSEPTDDAVEEAERVQAEPKFAVYETGRQKSQDLDPVSDAINEEGSVLPHGQRAIPAHPPLLVDHINEQEVQTQLPTPDQSQREYYSPEHKLDNEPNKMKQQASAGLPSPGHTQGETAEGVAEDVSQAQVAKEIETPSAVITKTTPQLDEAPPRRTSQRLSARKSSILNNISSPYFTSRKSGQALSSSPSRKENINPEGTELSSLPSSPEQQHAKSRRTTTSDQEAGEDGIHLSGVVHTLADMEVTEPLLSRRRGRTTSLAYYPSLATLHEHFGQLVDIQAVCTEQSSEPERSKSGPKDYHTTLRLADSSLDSGRSKIISAQIFRPVKDALPITKRGDVVILRNFKVQTAKRKFMLLSADTSSWAVFQSDVNGPKFWSDVIVSGPPIEYGPDEMAGANVLVRWWQTNGKKQCPTSSQAKEKSKDDSAGAGTKVPGRIKGALRFNNKPLPRDRREGSMRNNFANEGEEDTVTDDEEHEENAPSINETNQRRESTISLTPSASKDAGREFTPRRSTMNRRSPSVVHELRDGTKYVDDERQRSSSVIHELRDGVTYVDE
ncbi:uncharacterized protein Z518_00914 [Rhinocladiella mackenziei CBS 650.93]|uniref:Telomeric single stranded DNA binding POT1/Cdc13 domain-containing protein n=1 Tax=Rhinocladiella mackenziei CBS 650.93 TaxID=1442369 RepID=A0A0D2HGN0_9EURO|nr:uncharacterized protein Z518_00914 [Rhinocladiella mackenziei CBS 650.93]KIX09833.1 hypothetical protein Z518_00914 [Rhinocladiella mackenziei CBS 650.93]